MLQMSRPRKPRKGEPKGALLWWDEPEKLQRLIEYCRQDVRVERAIAKRVRRLDSLERRVYLLDQKVNDRGVHIDVPLIEAAQKIVAEGTLRGNAELRALTEGEVGSVTKVADLTKWLQAAGADIDNLRKDTIRDFLDGFDGDDEVRRVAEIRQEIGKSSTAKLEAFLSVVGEGDRARGLLLYHGASTGRWAGRLIQPQNFPRPSVPSVEDFIPRVLAGDFDLIEIEEPALIVVSSMLRSMISATPGHRLIAGDYAQIEARVVAWIAGQDDLVAAFAAGAKIYEEMGAAYSGKPLDSITKDSDERQVGKNSVLGCGFGMGADRFAEQVQQQSGIVLPRGERDEKGKLLEGEVDVAQLIIKTYRTKFPLIPQFWKDINNAARGAVREPGRIFRCGRNDSVRFVVRGQFLWCVLPSGRPLAYARPRLERHRVVPKNPEMEPFTTESVTFMSVDSVTRKWKRTHGYGGLFTENVVQGTARDLLADAMLREEDAGYPIVIHTHDEAVADVPEGHGSLDEFLEIMRECPQWAEGLPVAVDGWEGERYRK